MKIVFWHGFKITLEHNIVQAIEVEDSISAAAWLTEQSREGWADYVRDSSKVPLDCDTWIKYRIEYGI